MRLNKKVIAITVVLASMVFLLSGCFSPGSSSSAAQNQAAAVQRGNISVDITASGNLALSVTQDLAFQLAGTVAEVSVKVGDYVKKGQVLAKLDDTEWQKNIKSLEDKVTTAQRNLTSKQRAVTQSQSSLETAGYNLWVMEDVKKANDDVVDAQNRLDFAFMKYQEAVAIGPTSGDPNYWFAFQSYWQLQINDLKQEIKDKQEILADVLSDHSASLPADVNRQVALKQQAIEIAKANVEDAVISTNDAQKSIDDAQSDLNDAKNTQTTIVAPFDGFVTNLGTSSAGVTLSGGVNINKGQVAVTIADLTKFEAEVLVSEKDIFSVKESGQATVGVDVLTGVSYPAKIVSIAPTATIQSGVVSYKVKVEIDTTQPVRPTFSGQSQSARPASGSGQPSSGGSQPGQTGQGQSPRSTSGSGQTTAPAGAPQSIQLKQGLSVTVTIPVAQRTNVLMVPNRAVVRQGRDTSVQVIKDGVTTSRKVTTGINDLQYTEVTEGLNEGEQVVIQQVTAPTSTSTSGQRPGGNLPVIIPR